ncbi:MAG: glycosyltransferase family 2 protein [Bacteroidales bacterium]
MKVAVVLLNWNGKGFLKQFLTPLLHFSTLESGEVEFYVADNGSTDGSVEWLNSNYPNRVKLIKFEENHGFAQGYNLALKEIEAEYYLLLNTDVEVTPGWLQQLVDEMDRSPDVAIAMPKIRSYSSREHFEYAGAAGGFIDRWGFPFCRGRILSCLERDLGQYESSIELFWASGAAFIVRAPLFHSLGGFDGRFFAHMEEIDLCWRAKREGWRIAIFPKSMVYHVGGGTLPNNSPYKLMLNYRNNLFMLYKNLPSNALFWVFLVRGGIDFLSSLLFLIKGEWQLASAVWKGYRQFLATRGELKREREASPKVVSVDSIYRGSILFAYALRGGKLRFSQIEKKIR